MGTLDPIATGVLILGVGRGTKLTDVLLNEDKEYVAEVTLGIATDTLDTDGKVIDKVKNRKVDPRNEGPQTKINGNGSCIQKNRMLHFRNLYVNNS